MPRRTWHFGNFGQTVNRQQHAHFRRLPHTVTGEFVSNGNYYKYIVVVAQVDHDAMNIDYGRVPFLVVLLATGRHVRNGQVLPGQSACH